MSPEEAIVYGLIDGMIDAPPAVPVPQEGAGRR
jgi:ATP-dependent protease ClpP protease subunit